MTRSSERNRTPNHRGKLKNQLKTLVVLVGLTAVLGMAVGPQVALAGDNIAIGDIAGIGADLDSSAVFTLNSVQLALVKTAFLTATGAQLTSGDNLPKGTLVDFMIYVENTTPVGIDSVNVQDILDASFAYQSGTIRVDASENDGTAVATVYSTTAGNSALLDAVNGVDVAGIAGSTISAGDGAGNALVTVPGNKIWAMVFTVKMQ